MNNLLVTIWSWLAKFSAKQFYLLNSSRKLAAAHINNVVALTTSRRLTCIHAKLFPTVKRRTCIHVLRHYSRNSYSNFGRHAIFSESSGSRLGDLGQKALQTTIKPTLFVDFCLIPLSNTCSFVWPARNVNREIFLHCQEGFCVWPCGRPGRAGKLPIA